MQAGRTREIEFFGRVAIIMMEKSEAAIGTVNGAVGFLAGNYAVRPSSRFARLDFAIGWVTQD